MCFFQRVFDKMPLHPTCVFLSFLAPFGTRRVPFDEDSSKAGVRATVLLVHRLFRQRDFIRAEGAMRALGNILRGGELP